MLKTSESTESTTRHGKGGFGVGGDCDDDNGHDNDAPSSSSSTDSSTNTTQIAVEYDGVDDGGGKWVKELSKSRKTFTKALIFRWFINTKNSNSR